jgi:hypothetical protein
MHTSVARFPDYKPLGLESDRLYNVLRARLYQQPRDTGARSVEIQTNSD